MPDMHDVVIVGGGVAGCYLSSLLLGTDNLDILVLEKDKKVRPKDSGIVSTDFEKHLPLEGLMKAKIKKMRCVSPGKKEFFLSKDAPFAYILKREKFSRFLRNSAGKIKYETVIQVTSDRDGVTVVTNKGKHRARVVVGTDGTKSVVRSSFRIPDPKLSVGIMVKAKEKMRDEITVFFNKYYSPDYFAWIIPQNKEYGLITAIRPKEYLDFFAKKENLPQGKMYAYTIPIGTTKSFADRCLLVGDSCGQNKPLTGGGIMYSIIACKAAAGVIEEALRRDRTDKHFLGRYEDMWKKEFAWEIKKQMIMRKMYRKLTNKEIDDLFDTFGSSIENIDNFDYDMLTLSSSSLSKTKMAKFFVSKIRHTF